MTDHSTEYPQCPRVAVGGVVFKDGAVLLVKRGKPPSKGIWAIPGGSVSLGETLQAAVERELFEETGVHVRAGRPVYTFDVVERDETGRVRFHYVIVDLAADYVSGNVRAGDDALAARWVSPEELCEIDVNSKTLTLLKDAFNFGG